MAIKILQNICVKTIFLLHKKQDYIQIEGTLIKELYLRKEKGLINYLSNSLILYMDGNGCSDPGYDNSSCKWCLLPASL